jgi:hypothetical protein
MALFVGIGIFLLSMLCAGCYITKMRGDSGRIVIEIDPEMKRRLYATLAVNGSTLKEWFIREAETFCAEGNQLSLFNKPPDQRSKEAQK